ncbi:MAG: N-acetylmuramoyl-L-alanine amidase [Desulfobacterales bacterium]|nr:N-acetylmuramoyl-L-alanine amidase [Desulfobacterales bacterium]
MLLKLETPYQRGPAVRRWQEILGMCGRPVDLDAIFGPATDKATRYVQAKLGVAVDGKVGPATWNAAFAALGIPVETPPPPWPVSIVDGVEIHDCRDVFKPPKNYTYNRTGAAISGVMIHRTACILGENPLRWESVNCHIGVTMAGRIILMHHFWRMIWHGNGPSPATIGIEFDGNPEGRPGYWWKPGGGPHQITDAQKKAAHVLFHFLKVQITAAGGALTNILGHRQSSEDRECDPGWHCWQEIALPWMEIVGKSDPGKVWGTGNTIPRDWDPSSPYPFR